MKIMVSILLFTLCSSFTESGSSLHPFHVSNTEINYNKPDKNIEISCKIFTDDFESALEKTFKEKADFSNKVLESNMERMVKKYMTDHLSVNIDNKYFTLSYIGYEQDREAINVYLEIPYQGQPKSFVIQSTINYEVYDDQTGIIHVIVDGKRSTKKVVYPDKSETFNF